MHLYWLYIKTGLSFLKKAFIVFAVFFAIISIFFYFFTKDTSKQTRDPIKETRNEIYSFINDPELIKTEKGQIEVAYYRTSMCLLIGEGCTDNPEDGKINFNKSLFGTVANLIIMPYNNPPASGVYWARSGLENAGFIPRTYAAQGIGSSALTPFKGIWVVFRNFVFMIMVLVIVAIGFLIIFRVKINPQTVISVENALPNIVITLILITFSYPLAGFMIDMMYVVIGFILTMFATNPALNTTPAELLGKYFFSSADTLAWDFSPFSSFLLVSVSSTIYNMLPGAIHYAIDFIATILLNKLGTSAVGAKIPGLRIVGKIPDLMKNLGTGTHLPFLGWFFMIMGLAIETALLSWLINAFIILLITAILGLSLLFIFLKLFFLVLSAYLNILFLIIFSPLIIGLNAIPGRSTFTAWFKNLLSHLLTFPMVIAIVQVVLIIQNTPTTGQNLWQPPYFFGMNGDVFKSLVAGGILLMTPDLIRSFKELMGFKPMPINFGIGSMFTGAQAVGGGAMGLVGQISSINLATQAFKSDAFFGRLLGGRSEPAKTITGEAGGAAGRIGQAEAPTQSSGQGPSNT